MTTAHVPPRSGLSLRAKLTLSFVSLSCGAIITATTALTFLNQREVSGELREKAIRFSRLLEPQLRPVVAFDDQLTAREVFDAFSSDRDVIGLAVYDADGAQIYRYGESPARLVGGRPEGSADPDTLAAVLPVVSPEGPRGSVYVNLSTRSVKAHRDRSALAAAAVTGGVLLIAIPLATLVARPVSLRIGTLGHAAARVASGEFEQPPVPAGPSDEIGHLVAAFNVMVSELRRQFTERAANAADAQARLEAEVAARTAELRESREQYRLIAESTNVIPFTFDQKRSHFVYVGPQAERRLGYPPAAWEAADFLDRLLTPESASNLTDRFAQAAAVEHFEVENTAKDADGHPVHLRWVVSSGELRGEPCLRGLILDITDQRRLENQLAQAQKLESVGRLAAGVAHEINTPIQYVADSIHFVRDATNDLIGAAQKVRAQASSGGPAPALRDDIERALQDADLDYISENVPRAFDRSLDGLDRVAQIVKSMKEFAHPDAAEMTTVDLNRAVESTLTIARNEYKYVADVYLDLQPLPPVRCQAGAFNQAVLNIVVNAAHAIEQVVGAAGGRGLISVQTGVEPGWVFVRITDTGAGIPAQIQPRIFDPFFTTKDVGKGTGQGLAIARAVIVDKHRGTLNFETIAGRGTTFTIRLPIDAPGGQSEGGGLADRADRPLADEPTERESCT